MAKRRSRDPRPHPASPSGLPLLVRDVRGLMRLQRSALGRLSEYVRAVGERASSGSIEPRLWMEDYAKLWSGIYADLSALVEDEERGGEIRAPEDWVRRVRGVIVQHTRAAMAIPIHIHPAAFDGARRITLAAGAFQHHRGEETLVFGEDVNFFPSVVTREDPYTELKLGERARDARHPLPAGLYTGAVWAEKSRTVVAVVEIRVVKSADDAEPRAGPGAGRAGATRSQLAHGPHRKHPP